MLDSDRKQMDMVTKLQEDVDRGKITDGWSKDFITEAGKIFREGRFLSNKQAEVLSRMYGKHHG